MDIRYSCNQRDFKRYTTEETRREFLIEKLFEPDQVLATYSHVDRMVTVGIMPVQEKVPLDKGIDIWHNFGTTYFLERRECGMFNVGGAGSVTVDGNAAADSGTSATDGSTADSDGSEETGSDLTKRVPQVSGENRTAVDLNRADVAFDLYLQAGTAPSAADRKIASGLTVDADGSWTSKENDKDSFLDPADPAFTTSRTFAEGLPSGTYYFKETASTEDLLYDDAAKSAVYSFTVGDTGTGAHNGV